MRVCPKCGYIDQSNWRQNRWRTNVDFIELSEFRNLKPKLAEKFEKGHPYVKDKLYAYRLSGRGKWIVERIIIQEYEVAGGSAFHIPREHVDHFKDPWQKKLVVNVE